MRTRSTASPEQVCSEACLRLRQKVGNHAKTKALAPAQKLYPWPPEDRNVWAAARRQDNLVSSSGSVCC